MITTELNRDQAQDARDGLTKVLAWLSPSLSPSLPVSLSLSLSFSLSLLSSLSLSLSLSVSSQEDLFSALHGNCFPRLAASHIS